MRNFHLDRPLVGVAILLLLAGVVQLGVLAWLYAGGESATATVLRVRDRSAVDVTLGCARGMSCVEVMFDRGGETPLKVWVGRGVPQGVLPANEEPGDKVQVIHRPCSWCLFDSGYDELVKLRTFDGTLASPLWCLLLSVALFVVARIVARPDDPIPDVGAR